MAAPIVSAPTRRRAGALRSDAGNPPTLRWARPDERGHWVSFLVVREGAGREGEAESDATGLLTAVDSWERRWRYPEVQRTPFHYAAGRPPATLPAEAEAIYFGIRRDGWVWGFDRVRLGERARLEDGRG